jgi:hypothetical protein
MTNGRGGLSPKLPTALILSSNSAALRGGLFVAASTQFGDGVENVDHGRQDPL